MDAESLFEAVELAMVSAYKKARPWGDVATIVAHMNRETGEVRCYIVKTVVEDVYDNLLEISLEDAQKINPDAQIDDTVEVDEQTEICLSNVTMLKEVDCEHHYTGADGFDYVDYVRGNGRFKAKEGNIPVLVVAEAGQKFGFETTAYQAALNEQFGTPDSSVEYVSPLTHLFNADGSFVDVYEDN